MSAVGRDNEGFMLALGGSCRLLLDRQEILDFNWPEGKFHFRENDETS